MQCRGRQGELLKIARIYANRLNKTSNNHCILYPKDHNHLRNNLGPHGTGGGAGTQGSEGWTGMHGCHSRLFPGFDGLPALSFLGAPGLSDTPGASGTGRISGAFFKVCFWGTVVRRSSDGEGCLEGPGTGIGSSLGPGKIPGSFGRSVGALGAACRCGVASFRVVVGGLCF